jgi:hypothetical protein
MPPGLYPVERLIGDIQVRSLSSGLYQIRDCSSTAEHEKCNLYFIQTGS